MEENQTPAPKKSMNMTLIVGVVVAILVLGAGALFLGNRGANAPTATPTQNTTQQETTSPTTATSEATSSVSIETKNFAFSPSTIKVKAGGTISYTNKDSVAHSFTADDGKSFDSGLVAKDQTKTITAPSEPGEYPFHCTTHPNMTGTLIVE